MDPIFDNFKVVIWMNSFDCCSEREFIPTNPWMAGKSQSPNPIEAFYSKLNLSRISECDYGIAQRVWKEFGMKNLGDCVAAV